MGKVRHNELAADSNDADREQAHHLHAVIKVELLHRLGKFHGDEDVEEERQGALPFRGGLEGTFSVPIHRPQSLAKRDQQLHHLN
jgi:hypothetical protein